MPNTRKPLLASKEMCRKPWTSWSEETFIVFVEQYLLRTTLHGRIWILLVQLCSFKHSCQSLTLALCILKCPQRTINHCAFPFRHCITVMSQSFWDEAYGKIHIPIPVYQKSLIFFSSWSLPFPIHPGWFVMAINLDSIIRCYCTPAASNDGYTLKSIKVRSWSAL